MKLPQKMSKLFLVFTMILSVSGCRFGNYSEPVHQTISKIWNLGTEVQSFQTLVIFTDKNPDGSHVVNSNPHTPLLAVPSSVTAIFSDPVEMVFPVDPTASVFFYNPASQYTMATQIDGNTITADASSDVTYLWKNTSCLTQMQIYQDGAVDLNNHNTFTDASTGTQKQTDGRLALDLTVVRVIQGDCLADLKELAQCYQDRTTCTDDAYLSALTLFDLYAHYGGVLALDDATLARIQGLAYVVHFQ